jgi:hypothetical protein
MVKPKRPFTGEARPVESFVIVPMCILILTAIFAGVIA